MSGGFRDLWRQYLVVVAVCAEGSVVTGLVPPLLQDWGYAVAAIGLLVAVQAMVALASRLPGGMFYRLNRARRLLFGTLLLGVVTSALHPLASALPAFVVVRALTGLSFGLATTTNFALFTEGLPPGRARQHALGYYTAGIAVGYSLGAFVAGYAADWLGTPSAFLLAVAFGVVSLLGVPPRPVAGAPPPAPEPPLRLAALRHPRLLSVAAVAFSLFISFQFWNTYLPLYGLAIGLTLGEVGLIRGAFGLCQVVARPVAGNVVDRFGAGRLVVVGLLVQTLTLMAVPLTESLVALLALFVLQGTVRALAIVANAVELVDGSEAAGVSRGVMAGVYNTAMDLGTLAGPAVGGLVASGIGVPGSFVVVPLVALAAWGAAVLAARPAARIAPLG